MDAPLIIENLTKRFGKTVAVDKVSFTVAKGEAVGLIGPNASGKTTLISCCVGLLNPDDGRVLISGKAIRGESVEAKKHLAFAPELPNTVGAFTPMDHMAFVAAILSMQHWQPEAERLLKEFDLWEKKDKVTANFSKGERQKVMLSLAMFRKPDVLFLDEPLIGLDPRAALAMKKEVRALLAAGTAALICSHSLPLVEEVCTSLAVLSRGKLAFRGTADGLRAAARDAPGAPLEEAFYKVTQPGAGREGEA